ncbi:MAG: PIN domain-containing protein [Leptospirales bacterium]
MRFLVDTCVFSELLRKNPEPHVVRWMDEREPFIYLSILTLGELQKGVSKLPDGARKERIHS